MNYWCGLSVVHMCLSVVQYSKNTAHLWWIVPQGTAVSIISCFTMNNGALVIESKYYTYTRPLGSVPMLCHGFISVEDFCWNHFVVKDFSFWTQAEAYLSLRLYEERILDNDTLLADINALCATALFFCALSDLDKLILLLAYVNNEWSQKKYVHVY